MAATDNGNKPESLNLRVSPDGRDGAYPTLEAARDALRSMRKAGTLPSGGATVWIAPGIYFRDRSFELASEDSGAPGAPIVYRGAKAGKTRLAGGLEAAGFAPVSDPAILARLDSGARGHVLQADLHAQGINDFGAMKPRGFGIANVPAAMELFFNRRPMTIARWPNVDFVAISDIPEASGKDDGWGNVIGTHDGGFYFKHERLGRWKPSPDIWVHGYWCWDWANSYERVQSMNPETGFIQTAPGHAHYGFRKGQRFFFLNILEELDRPGEWCLDQAGGILYFWPPSPIGQAEVLLSMLEDPLVAMKDASHVVLRDLTLECGRGLGIDIAGGARNLVAGCTLRNFGNYAVRIQDGTDHGIAGCEVFNTGDGGVTLTGGDRHSLTPCNHYVENCHFHGFSRWSKTYCPGILAGGVGMRFAHNLLHDAPHTAILFWGNEFLIEYNEIHTVCMETGDAGAIYTGRDYTFRGNVVRHNFIHHMGGVGMGTMGVYNDDCVSGTRMIGNIFYRVTRAAMLGGGRDMSVLNNLFIDCNPAINFDARGLNRHVIWHDMVYKTMRERLEAMNWLQPPYSVRYPEILAIEAHYKSDRGVPPENCLAARNVCVGGRWLGAEWDNAGHWLADRDNVVLPSDPGFADPGRLDFRIFAGSAAYRLGFRPIPAHEIGPRLDEFRSILPMRRVVYVHLELVEPPVRALKARRARARVRAVVENPGRITAKGRIGLWLNPGASARIIGRDSASYVVEPGRKVQLEFAVEFSTDVPEVKAGVFLAEERFVRHRLGLSLYGLKRPEPAPPREARKSAARDDVPWRLVFEDAFADSATLANNWETIAQPPAQSEPGWQVRDGSLILPPEHAGETILLYAHPVPGAQRIEFDCQAAGPACDLSALLGMPGGGGKRVWSDGYFLGFGSEGNALSKFCRFGDEMKWYQPRIQPGQAHHVVCEWDGNTIRHFIDGRKWLEYRDPSPPPEEGHDRVGLYVVGSCLIGSVKIYTK